MPKKLTYEFVKKQFNDKNYKLISEIYINANEKLKILCPKNHIFYMKYGDFYKGHRCPECSEKKKYTIEQVKKHININYPGYVLLQDHYEGVMSKLNLICDKGHLRKASFSQLLQNYKCQKCYLDSIKGKNHPQYRHDLTDEQRFNHQNRTLILQNKIWTQQVYKKDNYTCQHCLDKQGGNLNSHHLYGYTHYPELRFDIDNGITLCKKCHKSFHDSFGYGNNTKEQYENWIDDRNEMVKHYRKYNNLKDFRLLYFH